MINDILSILKPNDTSMYKNDKSLTKKARNGSNDFSIMIQLFDHFNLSYDPLKLDQYWYRFLEDLSYGNFEVEVRSVGYENMVKNDCFLQISIGEQEYHLHDNFDVLYLKMVLSII